MALIEEFNRSGNWLFRWRSFLPLALYLPAAAVIITESDTGMPLFEAEGALICLAISLFGQLIRALTIGYTPKGTSGRNTREGQVAEVLNTRGIYSIVRHPLYLGNFFMWLGIILYVGNAWFSLTCTLLFWLYYERIMFAEEYFLRGKFGQTYLDWSARVPAFFPRLRTWEPAGWHFSFRNVLRREYSGFFAIFLSFAILDALKNLVHIGYTGWQDILSPFWLYALAGAVVMFLVLRTLKKYTRILHEPEREYT